MESTSTDEEDWFSVHGYQMKDVIHMENMTVWIKSRRKHPYNVNKHFGLCSVVKTFVFVCFNLLAVCRVNEVIIKQ